MSASVAVQIHGGIGTTREADIALFYRRAHPYEGQLRGHGPITMRRSRRALLTEGMPRKLMQST